VSVRHGLSYHVQCFENAAGMIVAPKLVLLRDPAPRMVRHYAPNHHRPFGLTWTSGRLGGNSGDRDRNPLLDRLAAEMGHELGCQPPHGESRARKAFRFCALIRED